MNRKESKDVKAGVQNLKGEVEQQARNIAIQEKMIAEMEEKVHEYELDLKRIRADFENYRKQIEAQKLAEKKAVRFATVCKILPLLDDIDRAIVNYKELEPLTKSLEKAMRELGLSKVAMEKGTEFNPELAEAVMADGEGEKEVISEVLRPGYYYDGEVLRPAMVKVEKI